ncbi:hypothetical protein PBI_SCTP2_505 [Salicola phage SCTP-2]|nr:hypothetical protein PBI_SCTP2_505 [Salicola phage SCTP-2]
MNYLAFTYIDFVNVMINNDWYPLDEDTKDEVSTAIITRLPPMSNDDETYLYCTKQYTRKTRISCKREALTLCRPRVYNYDYKEHYINRNKCDHVAQFVTSQYYIKNILEPILENIETRVEMMLDKIVDTVDCYQYFTIKGCIQNNINRVFIDFAEAIKKVNNKGKVQFSYSDIQHLIEDRDYFYYAENPLSSIFLVMCISDRDLKVLKMSRQWEVIFSKIVHEKCINNVESFFDYRSNEFPINSYQQQRIKGT